MDEKVALDEGGTVDVNYVRIVRVAAGCIVVLVAVAVALAATSAHAEDETGPAYALQHTMAGAYRFISVFLVDGVRWSLYYMGTLWRLVKHATLYIIEVKMGLQLDVKGGTRFKDSAEPDVDGEGLGSDERGGAEGDDLVTAKVLREKWKSLMGDQLALLAVDYVSALVSLIVLRIFIFRGLEMRISSSVVLFCVVVTVCLNMAALVLLEILNILEPLYVPCNDCDWDHLPEANARPVIVSRTLQSRPPAFTSSFRR